MKRTVFYTILCCLVCSTLLSPHAIALSLPDLSTLSYSGNLSFISSFACVDGNKTDFLVQQLLLPGLDYTYTAELELEGQIGDFYLESLLHFPTKAKPSLELRLENPDWLMESSTFLLKLPGLQTTFSPQQLKGIRISRLDNSFHFFSGTKAYETRHATITVLDEGRFSYSLFDSTAGDMVENSELVFVQGQRLNRYVDYKVNFLSGEIKFLIPLRTGSVIDVRYNYLPTGTPVEDRLSGAYYRYNFGPSYASIFYLDETSKVPIDMFTGSPEATSTLLRKHYLGSALQLESGPVLLSGELAYAESNNYGGNLHLVYTIPTGTIDYRLTTATPEYEGIGVVPVTAGETHSLSGNYSVNPSVYLDWNLSRIKQSSDSHDTLTTETTIAAHYQPRERHWLSLSCDTTSFEEWGATTSDTDVLLGWKAQLNEQVSLAYENSLRHLSKNQFTLQWNRPSLRLQSQYKQYPELIPYFGEYWVREFNTDWTWRPYPGISLTGDLDYRQPFDESFKNSRRRLALALLAFPHEDVMVRSNYIDYYNPALHSRTLFYDLASTLQLPYNLQLDSSAEKIEIHSQVLTNTDQGWEGTLTFPLNSRVTASLQLSQVEKEVFLESMGAIYQHDRTLQRTLSTSYQLSKPFRVTASLSDLDEFHFLGDSTSRTAETLLSLSVDSVQEHNVFKYQINYQQKNQASLLNHHLTWSNQAVNWRYDYTGELTHSLADLKILHHKEGFQLNWQDDELPYRPTLQLSYLKKDAEEQLWEKFTATARLAYEFTQSRLVFTELGHTGNINFKEPAKSYWGTFLKTGVEYSF